MNLNASLAASVAHVASAFASAGSGQAAYTDGEPGCGTRVPGFHWPRPGLETLSGALDKIAINPQPLPPGGGESAAPMLDDEPGCGNVPFKVPHWPPPPPPWSSVINSALPVSALGAVNAELGARSV